MTPCTICHSKTELIYKDLFDDRYGAPGKHSIYRCIKCGFARIFPGIAKNNRLGKFYSKYYPLLSVSPDLLQKSVKIYPNWLLWLRGNNNTAHYHIKPNSTVLDIGSGSGLSLLEIEKLGSEAYGVEPDPNAQKIAEKLNLIVHKGFITDHPFPKLKFDYITASQVIEHDPDPITFLKKAKEKLYENGEIILSFPNIDSIYRKIFGSKWLNWHVPYHLSFLTKSSLKIVAERAGLRIRKIRTITPNLWTLLQFRMFFEQVNEGQPSSIWKVKESTRISQTQENSIKISFLSISLPLLILLLSFINRIIDLLGLGDSYLVFLKRKNEKQ